MMKVIAIYSFLFSLDGSRVISFSKGDEIPCSESQKEKLIEKGSVVLEKDYDSEKDYTVVDETEETDADVLEALSGAGLDVNAPVGSDEKPDGESTPLLDEAGNEIPDGSDEDEPEDSEPVDDSFVEKTIESALSFLDDDVVLALINAGYTLENLEGVPIKDLQQVKGIGIATAQKIVDAFAKSEDK